MKKIVLIVSVLILATLGLIYVSQNINSKKPSGSPNTQFSGSAENSAGISVTESDVVNQDKDRFPSGTIVNGIDLSGNSFLVAAKRLEEDFGNREIKVFLDKTEVLLSYRDLAADFTNLENDLVAWYKDDRPNESTEGLSYDLTGYVDFEATDFEKLVYDRYEKKESVNAYLTIDLESGKAVIVPEIVGNILGEGALQSILTNAVKEGVGEISFSAEDFLQPEVLSTDENLLKACEKAETTLTKTITLSVCGHTEKLSGKKLWVLLTGGSSVTVSDTALAEYVDKLKEKYDTCGVNRNFVTSTGEKVVIDRGTYGWTIDRDRTIEHIKETILNDKKKPGINARYTVKGQRPAGDEFQGTYIEVSIENQHVWMYIDGRKIVDDDCCTGDITVPGKKTRLGMFFLKYKKRDVVLRGSDYADFVNYWMPYDKSIGLHDASWRTEDEFGGKNYIGNGSHGCVNLRHDTAETIYNNWTAEIPIIVW